MKKDSGNAKGKGAVASTSSGKDTETETEELKKIQDTCYAALREKVREIALQLHVSTNSVMTSEVNQNF